MTTKNILHSKIIIINNISADLILKFARTHFSYIYFLAFFIIMLDNKNLLFDLFIDRGRLKDSGRMIGPSD